MAVLGPPRSLETACESFEQKWRLVSERMLLGDPYKGMYQLIRTMAVPSSRHSAEVTMTLRDG